MPGTVWWSNFGKRSVVRLGVFAVDWSESNIVPWRRLCLAFSLIIRCVVMDSLGLLKCCLGVADQVLWHYLEARFHCHRVLHIPLCVGIIEGGTWSLDATADWIILWTTVPCQMWILARAVRCIVKQVAVEDGATVDIRVIETILHQCSLTYGRHEACVTLRHSSVVYEIARAIGVEWLIDIAVELKQIAEDLSSSQVLLPVWPHILVYDLFAFIDKCFSHTKQLFTRHFVGSIIHTARLVLNAS